MLGMGLVACVCGAGGGGLGGRASAALDVLPYASQEVDEEAHNVTQLQQVGEPHRHRLVDDRQLCLGRCKGHHK